MPPQQLFTAPAAARVPKRGRDNGNNNTRRQRNLPHLLSPPLPPLEGLSEADLETPGDGLAALMLLRQSWRLDTAGVWPPPPVPPPVPSASTSAPSASSSSSSASSTSPPSLSFCPPLLLKTQVHSLVSDRSAVDREIDALRRRGAVRALRLPSSLHDVALCFESDYIAALQALGEAASAEPSAAALAARALRAALPALPGASAVPARELEQLLLHAAHGPEKAKRLEADIGEIDALLAPLLRGGALAREHRSDDAAAGAASASAAPSASSAAASAFVLSAPGAGPFISALARGRSGLERALRRKRYREAPEASVIKLADAAARGGGGGGGWAGSGSATTGLRGAAAVAATFLADDGDENGEKVARAKRASLLHRPSLSGRFLVRDALGSGRLVRLRTTAGDVLRLAAERVG